MHESYLEAMQQGSFLSPTVAILSVFSAKTTVMISHNLNINHIHVKTDSTALVTDNLSAEEIQLREREEREAKYEGMEG